MLLTTKTMSNKVEKKLNNFLSDGSADRKTKNARCELIAMDL